MLIGRGSGNNAEVLLGLSRDNIRKLTQGKPIVLKATTHPGIPDGWEICICYGDTEKDIAREIQALSETPIAMKVDPNLP